MLARRTVTIKGLSRAFLCKGCGNNGSRVGSLARSLACHLQTIPPSSSRFRPTFPSKSISH